MLMVISFGLGGMFGLGLLISGMADPNVVLAFLDPLGDWDPRLAAVMAGALAVTVVGYRLVLRRSKPVFADQFAMPASQSIDRPLIIGAVLFGTGWGLVGFCPGPAIAALGFGHLETAIFVLAMLVGMAGHDRIMSRVPAYR